MTGGETEVDRDQSEKAPGAEHFELWAGGQAFHRAWSLYTGTTAAPFAGIREDGVRLRLVGGYGSYTYSGPRAVGVFSQTMNFKGAAAFTDALAGYQKQLGPLTVKAFAGLSAASYQVTPDDPETAIRGPGLGGKVMLETWWNISAQAWSSVDVSWGSLYDSYAARARLGWRFFRLCPWGSRAELPATGRAISSGSAASCATNGQAVSFPPRAACPATGCCRV